MSELLCPAEDGAHPILQQPGAVQAENQLLRQGPALSSHGHLTTEEAGAVGQRFESEQGLGQEEKGVTNHPTKWFWGLKSVLVSLLPACFDGCGTSGWV